MVLNTQSAENLLTHGTDVLGDAQGELAALTAETPEEKEEVRAEIIEAFEALANDVRVGDMLAHQTTRSNKHIETASERNKTVAQLNQQILHIKENPKYSITRAAREMKRILRKNPKAVERVDEILAMEDEAYRAYSEIMNLGKNMSKIPFIGSKYEGAGAEVELSAIHGRIEEIALKYYQEEPTDSGNYRINTVEEILEGEEGLFEYGKAWAIRSYLLAEYPNLHNSVAIYIETAEISEEVHEHYENTEEFVRENVDKAEQTAERSKQAYEDLIRDNPAHAAKLQSAVRGINTAMEGKKLTNVAAAFANGGDGTKQIANLNQEVQKHLKEIKELGPKYQAQFREQVRSGHAKGLELRRTGRFAFVELGRKAVWGLIEEKNFDGLKDNIANSGVEDFVLGTPGALRRLKKNNGDPLWIKASDLGVSLALDIPMVIGIAGGFITGGLSVAVATAIKIAGRWGWKMAAAFLMRRVAKQASLKAISTAAKSAGKAATQGTTIVKKALEDGTVQLTIKQGAKTEVVELTEKEAAQMLVGFSQKKAKKGATDIGETYVQKSIVRAAGEGALKWAAASQVFESGMDMLKDKGTTAAIKITQSKAQENFSPGQLKLAELALAKKGKSHWVKKDSEGTVT